MTTTNNDKRGIASTYKSLDTEERFDIYFNRPIGYAWALLFKALHIHPNVVTIVSILMGAGAGYFFYFPDWRTNLIGVLLLVWANHYDSADGQLARMTGQKTLWGRILDGFAGDVWFFSIYFFICLRLTPTWGVWIWLLAAFSGFICHSKQCALADYYRNIHLYFLKGKEGSELDNSAQQRSLFRNAPWKGHIWFKLFHFFYGNYTHSQEQMTPRFQRFFALVNEKYAGNVPQSLRDEFRAGSLPLMKWANILTFNTRAMVLYVVVLTGVPWVYFLFEVTVMNALFFYMRNSHEALCTRLTKQLEEEAVA